MRRILSLLHALMNAYFTHFKHENFDRFVISNPNVIQSFPTKKTSRGLGPTPNSWEDGEREEEDDMR